jgi:hypothetical protein
MFKRCATTSRTANADVQAGLDSMSEALVGTFFLRA